jgi:hypothetical protein
MGLKHVARQMHLRGTLTSKTDKMIKFEQIQLIFRAFLVICCPHKLFSIQLRHMKHFFSAGM